MQLQVLGLREKALGKGHPYTLAIKYDQAEEIGGRVKGLREDGAGHEQAGGGY